MDIFEGVKAEGKVLKFSEFKPLFSYNKFDGYVNPDYISQIEENADKALEMEIPYTSASLFREFILNGNRTRYEKRYFDRMKMLIDLTLGEYVMKSGKYMSKLIDVLWEVLNMETWILPAHVNNYCGKAKGYDEQLSPDFKSEVFTIDLFSAASASIVAMAKFLLGDRFEKEIPYVLNERIGYELDRRIIKPYTRYIGNFWWSGYRGNVPNNWCPWITSNVLAITALTCKSSKKRTEIIDLAIKSLSYFLKGYKPEGGCDEGVSYWSQAGEAFFDALLIISDMTGGKIQFFDEPIVKSIGEYVVKMNVYEKVYANYADGKMIQEKSYAGIFAFGKFAGSSLMCDYAKGMCAQSGNTLFLSANNGYRILTELCTDIYDKDFVFEHRKAYTQSDLQIANFRSEHLFISFKGGHNSESHNHNDVGTFIVMKDNCPVLIDTGSEAYTRQTFSKDRYKIACMRSIYHNTLSTDDTEQLPGRSFHADNYIYDEAGKSASLELANAYPKESGIVSYRRKCSLDGEKFVCENEVKLDSERNLILNLMTCTEPSEVKSGSFVIKTKKGKATIKFPEDFQYSVEVLPIKEHPGWEVSFDVEAIYRIKLSKKTSGGRFVLTAE